MPNQIAYKEDLF